jgi:hypothetical protein
MFGKKKSNKVIKFTTSPSGTALSVIQGASTLAKMELCDWNKSFSQYAQSSIYLESGALNRVVQYGGLGTQVTFLALKVEYTKKRTTSSTTCSTCPASEEARTENVMNQGYSQPVQSHSAIVTNCNCGSNPTYAESQTQFAPGSCGCGGGSCGGNCSSSKPAPFLSYIFESNPSDVRYMDDLMILTGTDMYKIPKVYLSNPNKDYDAIVTLIASTESITFDEVTATAIGDDTITVENLEYTDLTSSNTQLFVNSSSGTVVSMRWQDIITDSTEGDFEINGRIITIDDYVQGTINLSFVDEYHAKQAFSLMKWALCDVNINIITGAQAPDTLPPTINYSDRFSTEIVLADFPPVNAGTCGTSGTSLCSPIYISGTQGIILKEDLFAYQIDSATDDRDCTVDFTYSNLTLQKVGATVTTDAITEMGKYHMTFDVTDNACNLQTDTFILNVKDELAPLLVVSELGQDLYDSNSTSGNSGTQFVDINVNNYVALNDGFNEINLSFNSSTCGELGYIIFNDIPTVVEVSSIMGGTSGTSGTCDFVFDTHGVGNGSLVWDSVSEIGVTKTWEIGARDYGITFVGLGSFLFKITEISI